MTTKHDIPEGGAARFALRIEGRVQGVFYRESARREAERLELAGWVRNREDGSVEAEVQGSPGPLHDFVSWCHKGPPAAQVTAVRVTPVPLLDAASGFTVERSR